MGAKGAAEIIFKNEISKAKDREKELGIHENAYNEKFANPYIAASRGFIDEVIMPHQTRDKLIMSFEMLENKVDKLPKKKHGNIPL
jgi:propionyl-CoA carboxylase beta chain